MSDPIYEILDNLRKEVQNLRVENDRLRRSRDDEIAAAGDLRNEIVRLRARVSELESVLMLLCDRNYGFPSPLHIGEWSKAICAAKLLLEAKS